nr:pitrilysin family protein [Luteimonas sp. XNQY3]
MLAAPAVLAADTKGAGTGIEQPKIDYDLFTLPNGLTTLVHTNRSVPTVFVGVWYRVGSRDEPQGRTGFAHLFEHLMFQPTANRQGEYFLPLDKVGATGMNGTTNMDRTSYYQTVPSNALDLALWLESDRMAHLPGGITQAVLDEQREVVKNEKRQEQLQPGAKVQERHQRNYYPAGHPYAHTVIGSMEDLDNATLDDVRHWFEEHYGASNAVLVLSGDIDLDTAKEKVAHYFGDVPAGKPIDRLDQWIPEFARIKRDVIHDNVSAASLSRTWPLPNDDPRQATLLQLAARTLAGSRNTLLHRSLVDEQRLALNVTAGVSSNQLDSSFGISMALRPGVTPEQAGLALDEALRNYFAQGPDQERLDAIILGSNIALLRSLENNESIGMRLVGGYIDHGDPLFFSRQLQWISAAGADELKALARTWLDRPYYESRLLPQPATGTGTGMVDRSRLPEADGFEGRVEFPDIAEATLANGMKLVVAERRNLPIVDASLQFDTGSLAEQGYAPGVAQQAFGLLLTGTGQYDVAALARRIDRTGVAINSSAGSRQSGVNWSALGNRLDEAFALAAEVVRNPAYPQVEIDRLLDNVDVSFDGYERTPINSAGALYAHAIWGPDHPLGRIGSREDARKISREAIVRFHRNEVGPNNATLYLIGDIDLAQAKALADKHFGDWTPVAPTSFDDLPPAGGIEGRIILVDAPGAAQSSIVAGHVVAPFDKDAAATESLMNAALGAGFHSRLNMNLREDKGWAYGFSGGIGNVPAGQRVFTASGTVQADMTARSMAEIRREIVDYVATRPIDAAELERDRSAAIHAIPSGFTSNGAFLSSIVGSASYGLPYDRAEGAMERLSRVTLEQVRQRARDTFRPEALTWIVAGDLKLIERDIRALDFGPVEVWDVYGNRLR